jgi:hypothetical protein
MKTVLRLLALAFAFLLPAFTALAETRPQKSWKGQVCSSL